VLFNASKELVAVFPYRYISGTTTLSQHAYGAAIDINWGDNPQQNAIPADSVYRINPSSSVVRIFDEHGWG